MIYLPQISFLKKVQTQKSLLLKSQLIRIHIIFHNACKCIQMTGKRQSENTTMTHCRPSHSTMRKSHISITVTRHQDDKQSKTNNSLFPIKMITKLERAQCTGQQHMEQTQNTKNGSNHQQQNHHLRTGSRILQDNYIKIRV